jgi:uncharacterized protein (DUF58 family)
MVRSVVGFAGFAVVALIALKLLGWVFGMAIGLLGTLLWLAFWGFILYLVLRVFWPTGADRMRSVFRGNKPE